MNVSVDYTRKQALMAVCEVMEKNKYSNIVLNRILNDVNLNQVQRSFVKEMVYGVVENSLYIDWVIKKFSKIRFDKLSPDVLNIIRIGVYQILFMDRVPDSAAVNESVNIAKENYHKGIQSFVNGVLRNVSRGKNQIEYPDKENGFTEYLSVKYSFPIWIVEMWTKQYGKDFSEKLCISSMEKPRVMIRVNTLKIHKPQLKELLLKKEIVIKDSKNYDGALWIQYNGALNKLEEYKKGLFTIQDEGSMLVSILLNPQPHERVLDMCSAPGGKTAQICELMDNKGYIEARDISLNKINMVKDNMARMGIDIVKTKVLDGVILDKASVNQFDKVLLDAPCSGLGVIRKKPEIKLRKTYKDIENIKGIQYSLLENAGLYVKSGGYIVYSTCTINKEENEDVINRFISENEGFVIYNDIDSIKRWDLKEYRYGDFYMTLPHVHSMDGFFIAILKKL